MRLQNDKILQSSKITYGSWMDELELDPLAKESFTKAVHAYEADVVVAKSMQFLMDPGEKTPSLFAVMMG
jgi:hypothetical protein